jgi:hypothetical protein
MDNSIESIITTSKFYSLSAHLNFQLSGTPIDWRALLALFNPDQLDDKSKELVRDTLIYLGEAYGQEKRKLGPFAVLHPIRTASLLAQCSARPSILDLLTTLLHDKNEDITENKYTRKDWENLEYMYQNLIRKIDSMENWYLNERIHFLSREKNESYLEYLTGILTQAKATPELVRVKLADRLDNTLDLRMDLYEDTSGINCYQYIFEVLFTNTLSEKMEKPLYHIDRKITGAKRLYELYKSALFLSLLNSEKIDVSECTLRLYNSLAIASINEAHNIMLHIFTYHLADVKKQKNILTDVMNYSNKGGLNKITTDEDHMLDGLFTNYFESANKEQLRAKLDKLYSNKELMAEAAVAFAAIFTNFLNDENFFIEGVMV